MKKTLYRTGGYVCVGLGFAGAFLPLLPTTPFLILATYCFAKSSPRLHDRLLNHRHYGKYLRSYEKEKSIPLFVKITAIVTMCSTMAFTGIIFTDNTWVRIVLLVTALAVGAHIASLKTSSDE